MPYSTNILILILTMIIHSSCVPSIKEKEKLDSSTIIGIWTVTDFNSSEKFEDTWEFKEDGVFNELKLKGSESSEHGDGSLIADENGTWKMQGDTLMIIATGEYSKGKPYLYDDPIIWTFKVTEIGKEFKLTILTMSNDPNPTTKSLRLTKR